MHDIWRPTVLFLQQRIIAGLIADRRGRNKRSGSLMRVASDAPCGIPSDGSPTLPLCSVQKRRHVSDEKLDERASRSEQIGIAKLALFPMLIELPIVRHRSGDRRGIPLKVISNVDSLPEISVYWCVGANRRFSYAMENPTKLASRTRKQTRAKTRKLASLVRVVPTDHKT